MFGPVMSMIWGRSGLAGTTPGPGDGAGSARRLAGRVRRRNGTQGRSASGNFHIIGHEALLGERLFQHRVSALADLQEAFVADLRPAVTEKAGGLSERGEDVQLRQGKGGLLNGGKAGDDGLAQAQEEVE